jgi:4-aminobutyrate aminotransferase
MLPCVSFLINVIFEQIVDPEDVAAIFVEPIQGEGGYIVPPQEFHPLLSAVTKKHGMSLVVDEIQTGLGRTGRMFAIEHWGVEPDVVCIAKAIASGLPLGATVGRAEVMDAEVDPRAWRVGSHGSTFGGGPVSCAAGLATLGLLEGGLVDNARDVGGYMKRKLEEMANRHQIMGDVRGLGLMIGVEIVENSKTKKRFPDQVTADGKNIKEVIFGSCFKRGLVAFGAGVSAIRFSPPLIVSRDDVDAALGIFEEVVSEVEGQM